MPIFKATLDGTAVLTMFSIGQHVFSIILSDPIVYLKQAVHFTKANSPINLYDHLIILNSELLGGDMFMVALTKMDFLSLSSQKKAAVFLSELLVQGFIRLECLIYD